MGLFDVFRRKPAPQATTAQPPAVPFSASIETFAAADGLGTLSGAGLPPLKFGRSACGGFEPAPGLAVEVTEVAPHPLGGFRATRLRLVSDAASYDTALARRDAALGLKEKPLRGSAEAAAAARVLGWIIVLLDEAPPRTPGAFVEWARRLGLEKDGVRPEADGTLHLRCGQNDALVYVGDEPYPRAELDALGAPKELEPGRGFLGLSLGLPGAMSMLRVTGKDFDPWAPSGMLRDLSRLASALSRHGPAVILPQAGRLLPAEVFRGRLGDLSDVRSRPFGAWVDVALDAPARLYSSFGMVLHALPNVAVEVDPSAPWELDRAREAILAACAHMVHANAPLSPGECLDVAVGQLVGALPLEPAPGDVERYRVERRSQDAAATAKAEVETGISLASGVIHLVRDDRSGVRARWANAPSDVSQPRVGLNTYQELVRTALTTTFEGHVINGLTPTTAPATPPFDVDVWAAERGGFFMSTAGVGRVAQRFGNAAQRTDHVELVAAMADHHPLIANVIAAVGSQVHLQADPAGSFKAGDTVALPVPELNAAGFVLRDAGHVAIAPGPRVHLLELVPATSDELSQARAGGSAAFLSGVGPMSPSARAARWRLRLS